MEAKKKDEVMHLFAMEYEPGNKALQEYLKQYPDYSADLIELCKLLSGALVRDLKLANEQLMARVAELERGAGGRWNY